MGELGLNKIFGALLAVGLVVLGLKEVSTIVFGGGHHGHHEYESLNKWAEENFHGYRVDIAETGGSGEVVEEIYDLGALLIGAEHFKYAIGLQDHRYDPGFPAGVMLAHGYIQDGSAPQRVDEAYSLVRTQIEELNARATELGIPFTIAYAPPRFMLDESVSNNLKFVDRDRLTIDPIERIKLICDELDIPFVDPRDAIRSAPSPAYVISDYTHFASNGHEALARSIADAINSRR